MSCEVRLIAHIKEIDEIRRCLFPTDDQRGTDSWLQLCKISLSPIGDVIAIANERKIVILTSKWDSESSLDYFHITYSGSIHEYDKVKALVCIPIIDHKDKTHDWTCILVGFDSGHVRCYTETCEILFEEQFHAEKIISIKCQSQHNSRSDISIFSGEKIYIQYQSIICFLRGADFFPMLKKIKSEFDKGVTLNHTPVILPKKWGFQDQSVINDSAVVGVGFPCTFDYLTSISTCGGFDTRRQLETPLITLVLAAGSKPFLGYHYAPEAGYQHELIDVAKAVASKLISALPECDKVISRICDTFATRFPEKKKPSPSTVKNIILNFKNFGSIRDNVEKNDQKKLNGYQRIYLNRMKSYKKYFNKC